MKSIFIDRFIIPAEAWPEFMERMQMNRNLIRTLPGFVGDDVYLHADENDNLVCVTIANWESEAHIQQAKAQVQAEYQKQGFNMPMMLQRLGIQMERGQFRKLEA